MEKKKTAEELVKEIYNDPTTIRKTATNIHQKLREQGHRYLLADIKRIQTEYQF